MAQNSVVAEGEKMNTLLSEYLNIMSGNGSGEENLDEPDEPDTTPPSISLQTSSTENTITVVVTATDESGLAEEETYTYYLDNVQQGVATTESTKTYTGLQPSTEYTIKVEVKDKFGNVGQEEIKVSTTEPEEPDMGDAKPSPDQDGPEYGTTTPIKDDQGNIVVIPGGFHLDADSGTSVEEGIVIEDGNGNQFVWIPTGTYNVTAEVEKITEPNAQDGKLTNELTRRQWATTANTVKTPTPISGDSVASGSGGNVYYGEGDSRSVASTQIAAFKASASPKSETNPEGNGGFYIGRYEQGTGNVCKAGVVPYTNITRDTAKSQAEAMYGEESSVVSELISSYAWDTALNFICQTNSAGYTLATTTSSSYGNIGTGSKKNTGVDANDHYNKIHDLLGNCYEWTTEYSSAKNSYFAAYPCVLRGGYYYLSANYAAVRRSHDTSYSIDGISFRSQLYVK